MRTFVLLPLNKLTEAKSRLSPVLSLPQRRNFALAMARDILECLVGLEVVVVCREDVRGEFEGYEFEFLLQRGRGLGSAVEAANWYALQQGAEATLFLPADVPLIRKETVKDILALGSKHQLIVSPGKRRGIGMMFRRPPDILRALFTGKSFDDNLELAFSRGLDAFVYNSPELYSDIDVPEDFREFLKHGEGRESYDYLRSTLGKIL